MANGQQPKVTIINQGTHIAMWSHIENLTTHFHNKNLQLITVAAHCHVQPMVVFYANFGQIPPTLDNNMIFCALYRILQV